MNNNLNWKIVGHKNNPKIVLIHGWATNSNVWDPIVSFLKHKYCLYIVDLPGYGKSPVLETTSIDIISELIYKELPHNAFILGWSLGGLIALNLALNFSSSVIGLITIASSPCFIAKNDWSGLDKKIFSKFSLNLQNNYHTTIKNFIALQTLNDKNSKYIQRFLLNLIDSKVSLKTLQSGLAMLENVDLREKINMLNIPHLAIYGKEDKIVPPEITKNGCYILNNTAHLPFISQTQKCSKLINTFIDFNLSK